MSTLIICQGLPASGKTTWAEETILKADPGTCVRVNRDSLRTMLHADRWAGKRTENITAAVRDTIITSLLEVGTPIIISDDTNLSPKVVSRLQGLAKAKDATIVLKDFTDVPVKVCIERDLARPKSVGQRVINRMYLRYLAKAYEAPVFSADKPDAILVDIDGTLAHMVGRSPYDYTLVNTDLVDTEIARLVSGAHAWGRQIIIMSGRESVCREQTEAWLRENEIPFDALFMREAGDNRDDSIVKGELYEHLVEPHWNIRMVLDDRDRVVDMWRARGLKVLQVADGAF